MNCPRCDSRISADDANLETLVARCRICDEIFRFNALLSPGPAIPSPRPRAPRPNEVHLVEQDGARSIVIKWYSPDHLVIIPVVALFFGFAAFLFTSTQSIDHFLPAVLIVLGMVLTYNFLANAMNHTTIVVDDTSVLADQGPIPMPGPGAVKIDRAEIYEFFCDQSIRRSRYGAAVTYNVNITDRQGQIRGLVHRADRDCARFIVEQLDEWLGIGRDPLVRQFDSPPSRAIWRT
jgi:hypothetical protein